MRGQIPQRVGSFDLLQLSSDYLPSYVFAAVTGLGRNVLGQTPGRSSFLNATGTKRMGLLCGTHAENLEVA